MSISLDKLIKINSSVVNATSRGMALVTMLMSRSSLIPINDTQRALPFTSADQVASFFGINSAEYTYSAYYYKGYTGQTGMAKLLWIGRYVDSSQGAYIRGNTINPTVVLSSLKLITSGTITFRFNGASQILSALDFSGANSLSACASVIQTSLSALISGATVTYSSLTKSFTAKVPAGMGDTTVESCVDGSLATLLKMTAATAPTLSQGSASQSPAENWQAVKTVTRNWAFGSKLWSIDASPFAEALADCEWFNTQNGNYGYVPWSNDSAVVVAFKQTVADADYQNISINYSGSDFVAGQLGAIAAVDYSQRNARISLTNKSFSGVTPLVTDDATFDLMVANKINFYGRFQSRNDESNFSEEGWITGIWLRIENLANNIWVADQLQIKQAGYFGIAKTIPYNDEGYQSLNAVIGTVGALCANNGVAQAGNIFSDAVKQKLNSDAGFDLTSALTQQGWYSWVIPATPDERVNRDPVVAYFYYTNGGNIGKITINNNFVV